MENLSFESFEKNISQLKGKPSDVYHEAITQLKKLGIDKEHLEFYPKNIFTEDNLVLIFFGKDSLTSVPFDENKLSFSYNHHKYTEINNLKLTMNYHDLEIRDLEFSINGKSYSLNNKKDTSNYKTKGFAKKIDNIYRLIATGKLETDSIKEENDDDDIVMY